MSEANEAGEGGEGEPAGKFRNARVPLTRLALLADLSPTEVGCLTCCRFQRHLVRCFYGTGGGSWSDGSLRGSSSLRR